MNAHREVMTLTRRPTAERPRPKLQYRLRGEDDHLSDGEAMEIKAALLHAQTEAEVKAVFE